MSDQWQLIHFGWHLFPSTPHLQPPDMSPLPCNRINSSLTRNLHPPKSTDMSSNLRNRICKVTYTYVLIPQQQNHRSERQINSRYIFIPPTKEKQVTHKCVFIPLQQKCWSTIDMSPFHCSKKTGHYYVTVPLKQKDSSLADVSWCPCNRKTCHWQMCLRPPATERPVTGMCVFVPLQQNGGQQ